MALEKSLQTLIERHLEALLGVHFLASEYSTGKKRGGRSDTHGIDENGSPVIGPSSTKHRGVNPTTDDLELLLSNLADHERAKPLLLRAFEDN